MARASEIEIQKRDKLVLFIFRISVAALLTVIFALVLSVLVIELVDNSKKKDDINSFVDYYANVNSAQTKLIIDIAASNGSFEDNLLEGNETISRGSDVYKYITASQNDDKPRDIYIFAYNSAYDEKSDKDKPYNEKYLPIIVNAKKVDSTLKANSIFLVVDLAQNEDFFSVVGGFVGGPAIRNTAIIKIPNLVNAANKIEYQVTLSEVTKTLDKIIENK